jgi:YidC/Oxa1 family membrane protein insertase
MKEFFIDVTVQPFYNALIFLMDFITPDLGLAIIILTVVFRFILFPLSRKQIQTQIKMQKIQEPLKEIREKYKDKPEIVGKKMMELYKEHDMNPFAGFLLILIQMPLLIGFYWVFLRSGLPEINMELLYSFMPQPSNINTVFLGFIELTQASVLLAILVSITQYFQFKILMSKKNLVAKGATNKDSEKGDNSDETNKDVKKKDQNPMEEAMQNMQKQMTYVMPMIMLFIAYTFGSIIALYFLVSNLFAIGQELYIRKTLYQDSK